MLTKETFGNILHVHRKKTPLGFEIPMYHTIFFNFFAIDFVINLKAKFLEVLISAAEIYKTLG